jgi:hypothetical protein
MWWWYECTVGGVVPTWAILPGVSILFTHEHTRQIFLFTLKWQLGVPSYTDKWQWCRCISRDSPPVYTCNWRVVCQFIYMSMTCSVSIYLNVSDVWCINSFTCQWRVVYQFRSMSVTCGISIHLHVTWRGISVHSDVSDVWCTLWW